jgi:thymidylate synthase
MTSYRNVEEAFLGELREIVERGTNITVRGSLTRELRARVIELESVHERHVVIPGRNNNVFASIAESMWMLAGRDDVDYMSAYVPRAVDYSDDGLVWRAAYGPRLRDWNGIDQLAEVTSILDHDLSSRRAVVAIFDPDRDFVQSKDIPCNNWLHFLARDGQLDLNVAARSTDIWWGFSGINAFEWSLLLEVVAHWLGQAPGHLTFFTSSLHLYEYHFQKAQKLLERHAATFWDARAAPLTVPHFGTPFDEFDDAITEWMRVEVGMRTGADLSTLNCRLKDPLLMAYAQMIDLFWAFKRQEISSVVEGKLAELGDSDLRYAATEFLGRPHGQYH